MSDTNDASFYRVPFSTAEAEATLAALRAVADLLNTADEDEDSAFARAVHNLRLTPALLRSAYERICDEVPDFLPARADKEAAQLAACLGPAPATETDSKRRQLEEALAARIPAEIEYYVPSRNETTRRTVDVRGVYDEPGGAYLSGYCHLRRDQRVFKLENVRTVRLIEDEDDIADPFADD